MACNCIYILTALEAILQTVGAIWQQLATDEKMFLTKAAAAKIQDQQLAERSDYENKVLGLEVIGILLTWHGHDFLGEGRRILQRSNLLLHQILGHFYSFYSSKILNLIFVCQK